MSRLDRLMEDARAAVDLRRRRLPDVDLEARLERGRPERNFAQALARPGISVIAEHKRRSPSAGAIREDLELADVVSAYEQGGARALSVLTEEGSFGGSLDDLRSAREITDLPLLRKDFIVDRYQLLEAADSGADAVLLIVAGLEPAELGSLGADARALGLDVLVEVHDARELEIALEHDPDLIGINNRDLRTFEVNLDRTFELLADIPAGKTVVAESGITTAAEVAELERVGVDAVLVGEALMRSDDLAAALAALLDIT